MLEQLTTPLLFSYFLVFCRVGAGIMMMPGVGEANISSQARLLVGLLISGLLAPVVTPQLPPVPSSIGAIFLVLGSEIIIGVFIGTIARILMSAMHTAGMIIAYLMGLSAASLFDPTVREQSSLPGVFLMMLATVLIVITDLHHLFFRALADSYSLFVPMEPLPLGGFADMVAHTVGGTFLIAVQISAPHIIVGLLIYLASGVMGRLMPQMQVFFVMTPVQLLAGFFLLMTTLSAVMLWFTNYYSEVLGGLLQ